MVHTVRSVLDIFADRLMAVSPEPLRIYNVLDEFMQKNAAELGGEFSATNQERLKLVLKSCDMIEPDVIAVTCSTLSPHVKAMKAECCKAHVVEIDEAMTQKAVEMGRTIAVMATVHSTVKPVCDRLEENAAKLGKKITIRTIVCTSAMDALQANDPQGHDALLLEAAKETTGCDVILLAQASMARARQAVEQQTDIPTLDSPASCVAQMLDILFPKGE